MLVDVLLWTSAVGGAVFSTTVAAFWQTPTDPFDVWGDDDET